MLSFTHRWVIQTAQHLYTGGGGWSHFPQVFTVSSKLAFRAGFCLPIQQGILHRGPCVGDARSSHSISIWDEIVIPKIDAWASAPFHTPRVMSLQSLDQREVGLKLSWLAVSFEPHWCDQYLCHQYTDTDSHTPLIPLH